jgi:hypothetical protein
MLSHHDRTSKGLKFDKGIKPLKFLKIGEIFHVFEYISTFNVRNV